MGSCTSCSSQTQNKYITQTQKFDAIPHDIESYKIFDNVKLPFSATIANFKIKKCPFTEIGFKISINNQQYYKLTNKIISEEQAKWKFQKKIQFLKTQYQLRKSFLNIDAINQKQQILGSLKINMFLISTGPYHQDFSFHFKDNKIGRISFDFKVSQLIDMTFQSLQTQINLVKKHPGENFAFSIQTIVRNYTDVSMPSYPVQVVVDQQMDKSESTSQQLKSSRKPIRKTGHQVRKLKQHSNPLWKKQYCEQMPSVNLKILFNELHQSYFQVLFIKFSDNQTQRYSSQAQQFFGQCYIPLYKLLTSQPQTFLIGQKFYQKRIVQINEKLWFHGRQIGLARLVFNVQNQKHIKQMQVCVRTQQGIQKTSPVIQSLDQKSEQSCKEVDQLLKLSEKVEGHIIQLQQCQQSYIEMKRLKVVIETSLESMLTVLEKSSKESLICYTYSSPKQMIKAQNIFVKIGLKIASYRYEEDEAISQKCWLILISLIKRDEFMLSHVGFNEMERKEIETDRISKLTKKKIEMGLLYQQFLYKMLGYALNSLNFKGSFSQRMFAELYCSYAYFRIPDFRNQMLSIISQEDDPQVPQWRGIQFSLNEDVDYTVLKQDVDSFTALFDWQHSFHKCLEKVKNQDRQDSIQLEQILSNQNWKYRFQKRGSALFSFIKYWVNYVEGLVIKTKDIQWRYFPGYNRLLKVVFIEMKQRKIIEYPNSLKITVNKLMVNDKIFSPVVAILLNKTNIYEPFVVMKTVNFISQLLDTMKKKGKNIHPLFNYSNFFKAIQMILDQSDFLFMLEATLIMLYTQFQMFHYEFKKKLCLYLLKNLFFKMFLHWSVNIRNVFFHFLIYRIDYDIYHKQTKQLDSNAMKLRSDYLHCITPHYQSTIKHLDTLRHSTLFNDNKQKILTSHSKDLYKIMKKKLMDKKLTKAKRELLEPLNKDNLIIEFPESENQDSPNLLSRLRRNAVPQRPPYLEPLVPPPLSRTKSEVLPLHKFQRTLRLPQKKDTEQQQVIALNKQGNQVFKNKIIDTTVKKIENSETNDLTHILKRGKDLLNPLFSMLDDNLHQLVPPTNQQTQYLSVSLKQWQTLRIQYKKSLQTQNVNKVYEIPKIKRQELYIDLKDYIPQKIDDW